MFIPVLSLPYGLLPSHRSAQFDLQKIFQHLLNHLIPNERRNQIEAPTRTRLFVQVGLFSLFFRFRVGVMVFSQHLDLMQSLRRTKLN